LEELLDQCPALKYLSAEIAVFVALFFNVISFKKIETDRAEKAIGKLLSFYRHFSHSIPIKN
jgi:hypothetical protein